MGSAVEDMAAFLLRDASQNAENLPRARVPFELLQAMKHLLLCLVPDAAAIQNDQVRFAFVVCQAVTLARKQTDDARRIQFVRLAAEGDNFKFGHGPHPQIRTTHLKGRSRAAVHSEPRKPR